jgi:hypothetical protein
VSQTNITDNLTTETLNNILLLSPLLIGGIIGAFNSEIVNNTAEKVEVWTGKTHSNVAVKRGWLWSLMLWLKAGYKRHNL